MAHRGARARAPLKQLVLVDAVGPAFTPESIPIGFMLARLPVFSTLSEHLLPRPLITATVASVYGDPTKVTPDLVDRYYELTLRTGNRHALGLHMRAMVAGMSSASTPSSSRR